MQALEERQEKIATLLINHPEMDLDKPNLMGRRPIHYAALQGMEGIVKLLIQVARTCRDRCFFLLFSTSLLVLSPLLSPLPSPLLLRFLSCSLAFLGSSSLLLALSRTSPETRPEECRPQVRG